MTVLANLVPFIVFCIAMTGTPGPNNTMVLAAAARGGLRGATALIGGIAVGSWLQMAAVGAGVGAAMAAEPRLHGAMSILGGAFLAWIAVRIALSGPLDDEAAPRPKLVGFWGGAGFQWINPKAWTVTTGAAATYLPTNSTLADIGIAAVVLASASVTTLLVWAAGGSLVGGFLRRPRSATVFNLLAAALMLASIFALYGGWS